MVAAAPGRRTDGHCGGSGAPGDRVRAWTGGPGRIELPRPAGRGACRLRAEVVDGDQRLWLAVAAGQTVTVIDYQGAPYLRFSAAGVAVNHGSEMYYSNQVPPEVPPPGTGPGTRPVWVPASSGHSYEWHDGRLHALAATALSPGAAYLGRWRIPLLLDGRPAAITGGLYYAPSPSIVWFWPIIVCLACVLAAVRLRRGELDERIARGLAVLALAAFTAAGALRSSCTAAPVCRSARSSRSRWRWHSWPGGCHAWSVAGTAGSRSS